MDGIIIIDKPKNKTSHDIVQKVRKIMNEKKVGHTGTLDPMATGVLPLLIGKGTLCSKYLINHDKIYEVQLTLGKKTDTADAEGHVIEEKEINEKIMKQENVKNVLETFKGKQEQMPPIYSAIKVNGKKLYEYARKGEKVEIKPRQIEIYNIELLQINEENKQIEFRVYCSKGTYIRSLCEDIAHKLNTAGYMSNLRRIQVGDFKISEAIQLEELENSKYHKIITIEKLFEKNEKIEIDNKKLELFLNGVKLTCGLPDGVYRVYNNSKFIGTGILKNELIKRDIIIN